MKDGFWVLIAFVLSWLVASVLKVIISMVVDRKSEWDFYKIGKVLMSSGGMPSAHTASMTAAAMILGLRQGFDSVAFAIMAVVTIIVAYDAVNVRYSVGEQGKLLKKITRRRFKIAEGHTTQEMLVGLIIGVAMGLLVNLVTFL